MQHYRVTGASRESGQDLVVEVVAPSPSEAERMALVKGVLASKVDEVSPASHAKSSHTGHRLKRSRRHPIALARQCLLLVACGIEAILVVHSLILLYLLADSLMRSRKHYHSTTTWLSENLAGIPSFLIAIELAAVAAIAILITRTISHQGIRSPL